jgi:hypothetical protein
MKNDIKCIHVVAFNLVVKLSVELGYDFSKFEVINSLKV